MTDRFMSGWGKSQDQINKLIISCYNYSEALIVKENADNRSDMEDIKIHDSKPEFSDRYMVQYHGRDEGGYESWFEEGRFDPAPKMTDTQVKNAQRNFMNIAKVFEKPTGAITQRLHDSAITERFTKFLKLQNSGLTAKQIEEFTFKLTDAEKISILSKASSKAPLSRELAEEMQRLFLKVYGEDAYRSIFGYKDPPEKEQWVKIWGDK